MPKPLRRLVAALLGSALLAGGTLAAVSASLPDTFYTAG